MTFSLRPLRRSILPSSAASVRTFVVSWKEAADRNESVFSDAFVMPRMMSSNCAGSPPLAMTSLLMRANSKRSTNCPGQVVRVALLVDAHLLEHLPRDELDVLVVDVHALGHVDLLHLLDEVLLGLRAAADRQQLVRVQRPLVELLAGLDALARLDEHARAARERVAMLLAGVVGDDDRQRLVGLLDRDRAVLLGDLRQALRLARLEQLDDARQAVRDVRAGDAAGVERAHRQLRAGLADRLRGDDADRVADLRRLAGGHRAAVARLAHAARGLALQHRAHGDLHDAVVVGLQLVAGRPTRSCRRARARSICAAFSTITRPRLVAISGAA